MDDEFKVRFDKGEAALLRESEPQKMTEAEIKAELEARLTSEIDAHIASEQRISRVYQTSNQYRKNKQFQRAR